MVTLNKKNFWKTHAEVKDTPEKCCAQKNIISMLLFSKCKQMFLGNNFMKGYKSKALNLNTSEFSNKYLLSDLLNGSGRGEKEWPGLRKENTSRKRLCMHISI